MDYFDENSASPAALWDWYTKEYRSKNPIVKLLLNNFFSNIKKCLAHLKSGDRILEIGCGPGISSLKIFKILNGQNHFEASEHNSALVDLLRKQGLGFFVQSESIYQLNRKNEEFDCLISLEVLEGLEDYPLALRELFRVAKKYVIISVPNEPLWRVLNVLRGRFLRSWGNTPGHVNHWSPDQLKKLVSQYGRVVKFYRPIPWTIVMVEKFVNQK